MYLWKYWRESRIAFGIAVLVIFLLFVLIFRERFTGANSHPAVEAVSMIVVVALYFEAVLFSLFGWIFGSFGMGRDLGEGSGSYLFSKPRSRAFFVWSDWGLGMAQLLIIIVLANLVLLFQMYRICSWVDEPMPRYLVFHGQEVQLPVAMIVTCLAVFLVVGLVFSVTYFLTVLVKSSRGVLLGAAVIVGYLAGGLVIHHYWPDVHLPSLVAQEFIFEHHGMMSSGFGANLWLSMMIRAGIVVLFPLGAQWVLERRDI